MRGFLPGRDDRAGRDQAAWTGEPAEDGPASAGAIGSNVTTPSLREDFRDRRRDLDPQLLEGGEQRRRSAQRLRVGSHALLPPLLCLLTSAARSAPPRAHLVVTRQH